MIHEHLSQRPLNDMAAAIQHRGRIGFGDVRRLERDILPHGLTCRLEAEVLIGLDRMVPRADRAWGEWFVAVMVDYVVWSERPTAIVNENAAMWLSAALEEPVPTRNAGRLVNAIIKEAERVHERLTALREVPDAAAASNCEFELAA